MDEFMIGFGKRITFDLPAYNPSEIDGSAEFYVPGHISTGEHVHQDFKVGVGMLDLCDVPGNRHARVHFFFDLSDTGAFGGFMLFDLTAWKFP